MNPWRIVNGAVCLNIFDSLVREEPHRMDDIVFPACCSLYIAANWNKLCFAKEEDVTTYREFVSPDVNIMKSILLKTRVQLTSNVRSYLDHLNGSLAFTVVLLQSLYNGNQEVYGDNWRALFQECWEVMFWYIQEEENEEMRRLILDFADHHVNIFEEVIKRINVINEGL